LIRIAWRATNRRTAPGFVAFDGVAEAEVLAISIGSKLRNLTAIE
jgi:hypothetical protein